MGIWLGLRVYTVGFRVKGHKTSASPPIPISEILKLMQLARQIEALEAEKARWDSGCLGWRVKGLGFKIIGLRLSDSWFRASGFGFRV